MDFQSFLDGPEAFFDRVKRSHSGDVCAALMHWTISDLQKSATTKLEDGGASITLFERLLNVLPTDAVQLLEGKLQPTGVRALPGTKSHYAVTSVTNMRTRSNFQLLTTGMIAYLYRALTERSASDACNHFDDYYNAEQSALIKGFLDALFVYDPSKSIDRYTSDLYTPPQSRLKEKMAKTGKGKETEHASEPRSTTMKAKTATITAKAQKTRVKDRLKKYGAEGNKYREVERSSAEVAFDEDPAHPVTVDPPADFYGHFFTFYNTHFDAIYKTTWQIHLEGRSAESVLPEAGRNHYIREEVRIIEESPDPTDPSKSVDRLLGEFTFNAPPAQWQDTILVVAPEHGKFSKTVEEATTEMMKHKSVTMSDLQVVPTNATVLTASWYAGKKRVMTDDQTTNLIFEKLERDQKIYAELNKKRVEDAKFREYIAEGPDAEKFADYMRETAPNFSGQALDEIDMEELIQRYRDFKSTQKIFSNDDANFLLFVKTKMPGRNLDAKPLNLDERKKLSREYLNSCDVPEIFDEAMALDFFEIGGPDRETAGLTTRREYVEAPMTLKEKGSVANP
jgi:hypothetical protein